MCAPGYSAYATLHPLHRNGPLHNAGQNGTVQIDLRSNCPPGHVAPGQAGVQVRVGLLALSFNPPTSETKRGLSVLLCYHLGRCQLPWARKSASSLVGHAGSHLRTQAPSIEHLPRWAPLRYCPGEANCETAPRARGYTGQQKCRSCWVMRLATYETLPRRGATSGAPGALPTYLHVAWPPS